MKRIQVSGLMLLMMLLIGCVHQSATRHSARIFEPTYKPVSGNMYEDKGVKFVVDVVLRTFGSESYFYAVKKGQTPFVSARKYLMFDIVIRNPLQKNIRIPLETVHLIGQNHATYLPLQSIKPDTNKSRFLVRNLNDSRTSPTMYGLMVFEPLPEWEKEIKLQFRIYIDGDFEDQYVLFKLNEPSPNAIAEWNTLEKQQHERALFIREHQDDKGYLKPADVDKLDKFKPAQ